MTIVPPPPSDSQDNEEFCPDCFAGLESSEHHEECVAPLDQLLDDWHAAIGRDLADRWDG